MGTKIRRSFLGVPASLLLVVVACSADDRSSPRSPATLVEEVLVTRADTDEHKPSLDSPAIWTGPAGELWAVTTAKRANQLWVHDATSGAFVKKVGREGSALGEFRRPNGIAIVGDLVLVVERDNKRIQVLRAPGFEPVTVFGADVLSRPYGIAVLRSDSSAFEIFVTDQYRGLFGMIPRDRALGRRVKRFRVNTSGRLGTTYLGAFGDTVGPGRLRRVESLAGDPDARILLIADEVSKDVKVYRTDGSFTGRVLWSGLIRHEPEGIALYACGATGGYWIVTDQHPQENRFLLFDRFTFEPVGSFTGRTVRNTDGIALASGAMYALHDDRSLGAFAWRDIATGMRLRADCAAG